jgi:hypothetical protein
MYQIVVNHATWINSVTPGLCFVVARVTDFVTFLLNQFCRLSGRYER